MKIRCNNCGNNSFNDQLVDEVFYIIERVFVVKNIQALVCDICGEKYFTPEMQKATLKLINNKANIKNNIQAEVYDFV